MSTPDTATAQAHRGAVGTELVAQARASVTAGTLRARLLSALVGAGDRGLTVWEALDVLGLPERKRWSVAPRFPELVRGGFAVKSDRVADGCAAYAVTEAGRAWAEAQR